MDSQKSFYNEISLMMFGFGDSHQPNPDTVRLVESIVLNQLRILVQEALKYSDGKNLKGEELVFLMRHNKHKMRRFVRYLQYKHFKNLAQSVHMPFKSPPVNSDKPKGVLIEFIERIDETGEFTDLTEIDEVKHARLVRADKISQALDEARYLEFCHARSVSFKSKGMTQRDYEKLRVWVDPKKEINFKLAALDVLAYMAYETVAEITDYALLIRMDAKAGSDPLSTYVGSYYNSTMFSENRHHSDFTRVYSGQPPLSVNEIKEVMRRVHAPQAGILNFGGKLPETHFLFAL